MRSVACVLSLLVSIPLSGVALENDYVKVVLDDVVASFDVGTTGGQPDCRQDRNRNVTFFSGGPNSFLSVFVDGDPYGYSNIYRTLKVGRTNDDKDQSWVWSAPELDYFPVRFLKKKKSACITGFQKRLKRGVGPFRWYLFSQLQERLPGASSTSLR